MSMNSGNGMSVSRRAFAGIAVLVVTVMADAAPARADVAPAHASEWAVDHASKARLIADHVAVPGAKSRLMAGIEIEIAKDWKTYWRHPGTAGVPPRLDWTRSENLAKAEHSFPAPRRYTDKSGDVVGYAGSVVLPVEIVARDPRLPVKLVLELDYGVCKDVCIPVQTELTLRLAPGGPPKPAGTALEAARARVPTSGKLRAGIDPKPERIRVVLAGDKPHVAIDAAFPRGASGADAFLEGPDGLWVPLPKLVDKPTATTARFHVDLTDGADVADLTGKTIRLTLVSDKGQSETTFQMRETPTGR
jgi:DsbC/DsbD-like thiol-disulfide interchange protein